MSGRELPSRKTELDQGHYCKFSRVYSWLFGLDSVTSASGIEDWSIFRELDLAEKRKQALSSPSWLQATETS